MNNTSTWNRPLLPKAPGMVVLLATLSLACGDDPLDPLFQMDPPMVNIQAESVCQEGKAYSDLSATADGYTLLSVFKPVGKKLTKVVLINMKGQQVKSWPMMGYPALMLPGGSVLGHTEEVINGVALPSGKGVVEMAWDGKEVWSSKNWKLEANTMMFSRQHHDIQQSPNPVGYFAPGQIQSLNGKFLFLTSDEVVAPAVSNEKITDDMIHEYNRDGSETGFTWKSSEHIDEMGFSAEDRKEIKANPNKGSGASSGDWIHLNSMSTLGRNKWYDDYGDQRFHPDNIMISSRQAKILAIINKKTGSLVWRVGPDFNVGKPEHELGDIVGQHHAHLIPRGLPGAGNVLLFDNGGMAGYGENRVIRTYSRVLEFNPVTLKKVWEYKGADIEGGIFSLALGAAQRLPNGNTLVTVGIDGMVLEVNSAGKTIWTHKMAPDSDGSSNYLYRAYRVPPEWLPVGINPDGYAPWNKRFTCPWDKSS